MATVVNAGAIIVQLAANALTRYHTPSFEDLCLMLRRRLNDLDGHSYTDDDIKYCVNVGYADSCMVARCHKASVELAVSAGTGSYDPSPIFEALEVSLGDEILEKKDLGAFGVSLEAWNNTPAGAPKQFAHQTGASVRVHPPPDATAASRIGTVKITPTAGGSGYKANEQLDVVGGGSGGKVLVVSVDGAGAVTAIALYRSGEGGYSVESGVATSGGSGTGCTIEITALAKLRVQGYSVPDAMIYATDKPTAIPGSYATPAILSRGEGQGRAMRPTHAGNPALAEGLRIEWEGKDGRGGWCGRIAASVRGEG